MSILRIRRQLSDHDKDIKDLHKKIDALSNLHISLRQEYDAYVVATNLTLADHEARLTDGNPNV